MAGLAALDSAGGCRLELLALIVMTESKTEPLEQKKPLEISVGGVTGRSIGLGLRGVESSVLFERTSCPMRCPDDSLSRTSAWESDLPLSWKVSAVITVRSSSAIRDACSSFISDMNWLSTRICSVRSCFRRADRSRSTASSLHARSTHPPTSMRTGQGNQRNEKRTKEDQKS
jgi:hypothetical protein